MRSLSVSVQENGARLEGELVFSTVVAARKRVEQAISAAQGRFEVDFGKVTNVDSAALSFWLCCQRTAESAGVSLAASHVPEDLQSIARLVGLDERALIAE